METQGKELIGTSAKKTSNSNYGKIGILKEQSGDESINDISENKEMLKRTKVDNTPFEIIGDGEDNNWISMGMFRLSQGNKTVTELKREIGTTNWELVVNVLCAVMYSRDMEIQENATKKQF